MKNLTLIIFSIGFILLTGCTKAEKKKLIDAKNRPRELVGKTFDLRLSVIHGFKTAESAWRKGMGKSPISKGDVSLIISAKRGNKAVSPKDLKFRVEVLDTDRERSHCPVFLVKALNKKFCGTAWWILYSDFEKAIEITEKNRNERHQLVEERDTRYSDGVLKMFDKEKSKSQ